jgi:hypothetical protein
MRRIPVWDLPQAFAQLTNTRIAHEQALCHQKRNTSMQEKPPTPVPKAPPGLKTAGKRFWKQVHQVYEFDGSPEVVLLVEECARTADVVTRLQDIVDNAGTLRTCGSRGQDVAIPELDALRAYRAQFAALIKQLDLPGPEDDEDDEDGTARSRPLTRSEAGTKAALARWSLRNGYRS